MSKASLNTLNFLEIRISLKTVAASHLLVQKHPNLCHCTGNMAIISEFS